MALKASAEFQGACPACAALMTAAAARGAIAGRCRLARGRAGRRPRGPGRRGAAGRARPALRRAGGRRSRWAPTCATTAMCSCSRPGSSTSTRGGAAAGGRRAGWRRQRPSCRALTKWPRACCSPLPRCRRSRPSLQLGARVLASQPRGLGQGQERRPRPDRLRGALRAGRRGARAARPRRHRRHRHLEPAQPGGRQGLPALGETEARGPHLLRHPRRDGALRSRYEGRRTLVVGAGHSAANALLALAELAAQSPATRLAWAVRSPACSACSAAAGADALPARGALGASLRRLRDGGALEFFSGLRITRIERKGSQLRIAGLDAQQQVHRRRRHRRDHLRHRPAARPERSRANCA